MPEDFIILHLCITNDNHDVWSLIYQARQTAFFVILGYFLPFYSSNNLENQNFGNVVYNVLPHCLQISTNLLW